MTALTGLRVLELAADASVEYAGRLLAGLGADVVKLEPPEGAPSRHREPHVEDGDESLAFWADNVGKRSAVVHDDEHVRDACADADVLLYDLRRRDAEARGLAPDTLRAEHPELVVCAVTPFGWSGPWEDFVADDLVLLALGGQAAACGYGPDRETGEQDTPPVASQGEQAHRIAATYATIGVLGALYWRGAGGTGQFVEVSVHECAASATEWHVMNYLCTGNVMPRFSGVGELDAADGKRVHALYPEFLGEHVFTNLRDLLVEHGVAGEVADPAFEDPDHRSRHSRELRRALRRLAAEHDGEDLFRLGQHVGLPWGVIRAPEEVLDDPHLQARGHFQHLEHEGRTVPHPGAPFVAHGSPFRFRGPPPALGEHTTEVLGERASSTGEEPV